MEGLVEGRMVHYVMPPKYQDSEPMHRPAIVTAVHRGDGCVSLSVFSAIDDMAPALLQVRVAHYDEEKRPDTWHWIEKACC